MDQSTCNVFARPQPLILFLTNFNQVILHPPFGLATLLPYTRISSPNPFYLSFPHDQTLNLFPRDSDFDSRCSKTREGIKEKIVLEKLRCLLKTGRVRENNGQAALFQMLDVVDGCFSQWWRYGCRGGGPKWSRRYIVDVFKIHVMRMDSILFYKD